MVEYLKKRVFADWINSHSFLSFTVVSLVIVYGFFHFGLDNNHWAVLPFRLFAIILMLYVYSIRLFIEIPVNTTEKSVVEDSIGIKNESDTDKPNELQKDAFEMFAEFDEVMNNISLDSKKDFKVFIDKLLDLIKDTFVADSVSLISQDKKSLEYKLDNYSIDSENEIVSKSISSSSKFVDLIQGQRKAMLYKEPSELNGLIPFYPEGKNPSAVIIAPVNQNGEVHAYLVVDSFDKNAYSDDDAVLIGSYSELLADTYKNYSQLSEFENSAKLFSLFFEVSKSLSSNLQYDELYVLLESVIKKLFPYDRLTISILENVENKLAKIVRLDGLPDEMDVGNHFPIEEGLNGWIIRKQKPFRISDMEKDELFLPRFNKKEKSNYGLRSFFQLNLLL